MNGSRVARHAGGPLAESSGSTAGSATHASSSSSAKKESSKTGGGMGNDRSREGNRLVGEDKRGYAAGGLPYSSSSPRLPAVPLLTEKQQQLLLRYLCISNDETSRMLMQAAARQQGGSGPGRKVATTAAVADLRNAACDRDDAAAGAPAVSQERAGGISVAATTRKSSIASGGRAAARASCSSPVSPFAASSRNTSNVFGAAASLTGSSAFTASSTPLRRQEVNCWRAAADERLFQQQQQPKRAREQQERVLVVGAHSQLTDLQERQQEQWKPVLVHEEQQEQQQQQAQLQTAVSGSSLREPQGAAAVAVPPVCPLRPCLRRRSNVRFRSPVAVDLLEEQQQDESTAAAPTEASAGADASPPEAYTDCVAAAEPVLIRTKETRRGSLCCPSSSLPPSCGSSCRMLAVPGSRSFVPSPADASAPSRRARSGPAEGTTSRHTQLLRCCCCCSASATCGTVAHVSGLQCSCSRVLCEDGRTAAPAPAVAHGRGLPAATVPTPPGQASASPAAAVNVLSGYPCDSKAAVGRCNFCCRGACSSSFLRGALCCCCDTCHEPPFVADEASSTPSTEECEESSFLCAAASLRRRTASSAVPAVAADAAEEEKATACSQELPGADKAAAAARGAAGQERATGGAAARGKRATPPHQFCRHLPSHEEEGPRPCCGPGSWEKDVKLRLPQGAYEGEEDEEICCSCCCTQHVFGAESSQQVSTLVASNTVRQDKLHSYFNAYTHPPTAICPVRGDARSASEPADAARAAPATQQMQATAAPQEDGIASQFAYKSMRLCCGQREPQHQRQRLPVCCCRQAVHTHQTGKEQRQCMYVQLPLPAVATAAGGPTSSCAAGAFLCGAKSASPSLLLSAAQQEHLQTERYLMHGLMPKQGPVQQEQTHAQERQQEQVQQQLQVAHPSGPRAGLHQLAKKEHQQQVYTCHAATSTRQTDLSKQMQQQQQLHVQLAARDGSRSSELLQRRCIYLRPATAAADPAAGRRAAAAGTHTPSTAATLPSITPPATPAPSAAPAPAGKEAVSTKAREAELMSRLLRGTARPAAGGAPAARTLTVETTATPTVARPAVAAVQTAAAAWTTADPAAATNSTTAAEDMYVRGLNETLSRGGTRWSSASNKHPSAGVAHPLTRSTSPAVLEGRNSSQAVRAASAGVRPRACVGGRDMFRTVTEAASTPVSEVKSPEWASGFPAERVFRRGEGDPVASAAEILATATAATEPAALTPAAIPSDAPRAGESFVQPFAMRGVGGDPAAPTANGTATRCEVLEEEEEDLQELLQRQQQELAEQLRRLEFLERRQHELRQPQLQRRRDWWERLHALEQQLQRQKDSLEQQRYQRGFETLQNNRRQQLLRTSGEQQRIAGSDVTRRFALERYGQRLQINGQQQPGDSGMPQSHHQQRRGSSELPAVRGLKGELHGATRAARPSSVGIANLFSPRKTLSHATGQRPVSDETNAAAPASLLVLSKSTRKFHPPQPVQQPHQQRYQQQEGLHLQQQRHQHHGMSGKWPSKQKGSLATRSAIVSSCGQTCAGVCGSDQPTFTVESGQLLLDEDEEEQELLELQEISEALEAAEF